MPAAAAWSNCRAVSGATSRVTGTVADPPADRSAAPIEMIRRSSPTTVVYGRAPAKVAYASTRSAVVTPSGTEPNPTVTATSPGATETANLLVPSLASMSTSPPRIADALTLPIAAAVEVTACGGR